MTPKSDERLCPCADPENCTETVPGYICRRRLSALQETATQESATSAHSPLRVADVAPALAAPSAGEPGEPKADAVKRRVRHLVNMHCASEDSWDMGLLTAFARWAATKPGDVTFLDWIEDGIDSLTADFARVRQERDRARRTNRFYAEALYFPGIRLCAVENGDDAVEISPQRIDELLAKLTAAEQELAQVRGELDFERNQNAELHRFREETMRQLEAAEQAREAAEKDIAALKEKYEQRA